MHAPKKFCAPAVSLGSDLRYRLASQLSHLLNGWKTTVLIVTQISFTTQNVDIDPGNHLRVVPTDKDTHLYWTYENSGLENLGIIGPSETFLEVSCDLRGHQIEVGMS